MPLTAYGRPLHIRPLSGAINVPRQKQVAPSTLAGWGRQGVPMTDTLAKPTANFTSARPAHGVPVISAWSNSNAPQAQGVTVAKPNRIPAGSTKGTTITGTPTAQRIPVAQGDPTVVRTPTGTRVTPTLTPRTVPSTSRTPLAPGAPMVTEASPGYTPRPPAGGSQVIELVEARGVWSPGTGYTPAAQPTALTQPNVGASAGGSYTASTPAPAASTGYAPPQTSAAGGGGGTLTVAASDPGAAPTAAPSSTPALSATGRPLWQYALGGAILLGIGYALTR